MARFVCERSKEFFATSDAANGTVAVCLDAGRHQLRVRATDLRTLAIIVTLAVTLTRLIPATSAVDMRRYGRLYQFDGPAVTRERSLDQITDLLDRLMTKRKLGQCVEARNPCYSSAQCCSGHVCVIADEYQASDPETPGTCVKEKNLTLCSASSDCPIPRSRCASLGRTGQRYCVAPPKSAARRITAAAEAEPLPLVINKSGGLGSPCMKSSDCDELAYDGRTALCCQLVHMHRQGSRQMCDRYRPNVSVCV